MASEAGRGVLDLVPRTMRENIDWATHLITADKELCRSVIMDEKRKRIEGYFFLYSILTKIAQESSDAAKEEAEVRDNKNKLELLLNSYQLGKGERNILQVFVDSVFMTENKLRANLHKTGVNFEEIQEKVKRKRDEVNEILRHISEYEKKGRIPSESEIEPMDSTILTELAAVEAKIIERMALGFSLLRILNVDSLKQLDAGVIDSFFARYEKGEYKLESSDYSQASLLYERYLENIRTALIDFNMISLSELSDPLYQIISPEKQSI